jgi:hypothetical protein
VLLNRCAIICELNFGTVNNNWPGCFYAENGLLAEAFKQIRFGLGKMPDILDSCLTAKLLRRKSPRQFKRSFNLTGTCSRNV